jgi:recombination associated protein RdgC
MLFRNLTLFRFPAALAKSLNRLEDGLESQRLQPCAPQQAASRGFVSPFGRDETALTHRIGPYVLLTLGAEDRVLPAAVIREAMAERLAERARRGRRRIGGRERNQLKDEVISDLLPRAFVRPSRHPAYLDTAGGWLVVDTAGRRVAEDVVTALRAALGRFPALPAAAEKSPRERMTDWLIRGKLPPGLDFGTDCELRDPTEAGAVVRCRRQELESDEIREHLKTGKQVFQLGLCSEKRIEFVLGEDLCLRRLRFTDVVLDTLDDGEAATPQAELDARFALMTLELERLLERMQAWFGLPRPGAA